MRNDMNEGPRLRSRPKLNNETRTLLRSRPIQLMLAGVAVAQGVSMAVNGPGDAQNEFFRQPGAVSEVAQAATGLELTPVVVAKAAKPVATVDQLALTKVETPARKEEAAAKKDEAEVLAAQYREKGFNVSSALAREIYAAALANDIEPRVAFGLVKTESGFKNSATSHVGAIGLTQLMPATARWLQPGVTRSDLRDSETNLKIGFRYLRDLIDKYDGDTELALLAYNRGPGTVDRVLRRGGNPDNGYADMVMGRRNRHR